jgi:putative heme-binding domain-containing protein
MAAVVLQLLPGASPELRSSALNFLVSRPTWSLSLLDAMSRGEVQAQSIPAEVAERLRRSPDATVRQRAVAALAASVPVPNSTTAQRIRQIEAVLKKSPGNPYAGEALFQQRCAACHRLFFKGGSVGPDLTSYQRDHLGTLLTSILDPSAEIREGYASVEVETRDGRTLSGFLTDRDDRQTTLRGLDGQDQVLPAAEVLAVRPTGRSLMPEGLLEGLSDDQLRDFFAFLRSSQPFSR